MFKWLFIALFSVETSCYLSVVIQYDHMNFFCTEWSTLYIMGSTTKLHDFSL